MRSLVVIMLLGLISVNALSVIRYVKPNDVSNAWQSKSNVYSDLQLALADAVNGDEIWVAEGVYKPTTSTDRTISFELKAGVKLYGGFIGTETTREERNWYQNKTILSGDIGASGDNSDNSYTVVKAIGSAVNTIDKNTVFDGFIVTGGNNQLYGWHIGSGGGMICDTASPLVANVKFENNSANNDGGGVYCSDGSNATFVNCIFIENTSYMGAGAYFYRDGNLYNCLWHNNKSDKSNADYSTSAEGWGVDLYNYSYGTRVVANSIFVKTSYNTGQYTSVSGFSEINNIKSVDPGFVDLMTGDYRLMSTSKAIDTGDNNYAYSIEYDYFGNPRIQNETIDVGPIEGSIIAPVNVSPIDFAKVSTVGGTATVTFTGKWEQTPNYSISRYFIQYWSDPSSITSVDITSELTYTTSFSLGQAITWRFGVELTDGTINYSAVTSFSVPRDTPFYVKEGANGDGSSWSNAFGTLNEAIAVAVDGEQIWVAQGTYYPTTTTDRDLSFKVDKGISIYGGFGGTESKLEERNIIANKTILSGDIGQVDNQSDNSVHVMTVDTRGSVALDGITIQDGNAFAWVGINGNDGGGLLINSGTTKISNVIFKNNIAGDEGGAIAIYGGKTIIANCIFRNNKAAEAGAVYNYYYGLRCDIINSVFDANHANTMSAVMGIETVSNSIFTNNYSAYNYSECSSQMNNYNRFDVAYGGKNNISDEIVFVAPDKDDYRLSSISGGINVGCNDSIPEWIKTDFAGASRIQDVTVDMGALEGSVVCPELVTPADGHVFKTSEASMSIELKGSWTNSANYSINKYILEYWEKGGSALQVETNSDLTATIDLAVQKEYYWRSGVVTDAGIINYSGIRMFSIASNTPYYVKEGSAGDGSNWASAFGTINEALEVAVSGDEIWVAKGTYYAAEDNNRNTGFELTTGVHIYGGFAGDETAVEQRDWRLNQTILSGNIGDVNSESDNTYSIIKYSNVTNSLAILDGLVISDAYSYDEGGGLLISKGTVSVVNCLFENNRTYQGSAIYNDRGYLNCYNTIFRYNKTGWDYVLVGYKGQQHISNCVFVKNESNRIVNGKGLITNSIIWGNSGSQNPLVNMSASYSCIQNGNDNTANVNSDPIFMDLDGGDYRLHYLSPCIDKGTNDELPTTLSKDFFGNDRIINNQVDIGIAEGGVVTPIVLSPKDKEVIKIDAASSHVLLEWEWDANVTKPNVESYTIEYWINDGPLKTVQTVNEFATIVAESGSEVKWRVVSNVVGELALKGLIHSFSIPHLHSIYVKEGANGDGSSWESAFGNLQAAIQNAVRGDEIWVANGIYNADETDRLSSFFLKGGVKLYGGFSGSETLLSERNWRVNRTVLSGNLGDLNSTSDNTIHIIECDLAPVDSAWIDGVIIQDGNANVWSGLGGYGAAILAKSGVLSLNNIWIRDNISDRSGSAVYNTGADITMTNTIMSQNHSYGSLGSTVLHDKGKTRLINCVVANNEGDYTGGLYGYGTDPALEATNSIICNNHGERGADNTYKAKVRYSLVGEEYYGDGNITGNPLFFDAENGDYRVSVMSPAINAGINDPIPTNIKTDMAGGKRILQDVVDMGCFEGGVVVPVVKGPHELEIIKGVFLGTDVTFEWALPEGYENESFDSYRLEYWSDPADKTVVEAIMDLTYTTKLSNGTEYQWKVIGMKGAEEFPSQVTSFSLTHEYAIKVKEGSSGYGDRWDYAFGNLQDAINKAVRGDEIWIAQGTYYPSETGVRSDAFTISKQIKLYGGFKGSEVYLEDRRLAPEKTILSGDIGVKDVRNDNCYAIVVGNLPGKDTLLIDGLTIEQTFSDTWSEGKGALTFNNGHLALRNSVIRNNQSGREGGGVYLNNSTSELVNCMIVNNKANSGGGVYAESSTLRVKNSLLTRNEANSGSAINGWSSDEYITNSIIWGNSGDEPLPYIYNVTYSIANKSGTGNSNVDPLFVDAENGNYRLQPNSPAINAGTNKAIPDDVRCDLDGIGRVSWATVDMGPYEASYPKTVRPADKSPERPSGVLGYTWTLGADIDGVTPDPNLMDATEYKMSFKSWDIDDEAKVYEDLQNIGYWGMLSFNFDYRQGYQWKVGVQTDAYTYWSDTSTFYIGGESPLYVKEGATGNGSSWDNAFGTIKEALDAAIKGDEIWIANGTYNVTSDNNREATLNVSSYLALYGGFNGTEVQRYERFNSNGHTIISGDIGVKNDASDNTKHIISMAGSAEQAIEGVVIDGLTISDANSGTENGGAIQSKYASYKVLNCYLSANTSAEGAAVYNESADMYLYNSQVDNNTSATAVIYGDASSKLQLVNNTVTANSAGVEGVGAVANTIVYGNQGTSLSGVTASYSCIEGGYEGEHIVTGNPDFQNREERNYRLGKYSSCFDQGSDSYLPTSAYMDLYKNERRTFYSQVDIGAFEVGFDQLGKVEPISYTPEDGAVEVDYESSINILFNQAVEVDLKAIVMTPQKVYWSTGMNQDYHELNFYHSSDLAFGETYTIEIPAEAITFKYNNKIPTTGVKFSFTIRDCKPAIISFEADNVELCLFDGVEIPVTLAGDFLRGHKWMKADTVFQESYYLTELQIDKFTEKYKGVYTMAVEDVCGNTITKDLTLNLKETTPIVIKDKWDDVVFIDNSAQNFSGFNWYLNGSQVETRQYLDLANLSGEVHVTATDAASGCTVYSDTLTVSGGGLKAMTVHPNPVQQNEVLHIKLPMQQDKAVVRLFDIVGNLVAQDDYENTVIIDYDKTNLKPGVYILEVDANGLVEQRKIIIQK